MIRAKVRNRFYYLDIFHRLLLTFLLVATCREASAQARCEFFQDQFFGHTCELHDAVVDEDNFNLVVETDGSDDSVNSISIGNNTALRFIPSSLFTQFPNVHYLFFDNAGIENLTPGSFNGASNVVLIEARHNSFESIPAGVFDDLETLFVLDISNSGINDIHEDAFANNPTLLELDINENNLTRISAGWFRNLVNLEQLNIISNHISEIEDGAFSSLAALSTLYLRYNQITEITPEMFGESTQMVFFSVNGNLLTSVPRLPEDAPRLHYVHATDNQIHEIVPGDFNGGYATVTNLDFSGNQLVELNGDAFESLDHLDILTVNSNHIASVDHELFEKIPSLFTFYFERNVCADARFDNVRSVNPDLLDSTFDRCFYHFFEPEISHLCTFVQDIELGYTCELSGITFQNFRDKFLLTGEHLAAELNDTHVTGIRIVNSIFNRIPPSIFTIFPNLDSFSLTDSDFSIIEQNTFEQCGLVRRLDLSRNRIQRLSSNSFHNCYHVTELFLDDNRVNEIEPCNGFLFNIYQAHYMSMLRNICVNQIFDTHDRLLDDYERIVTQYFNRCYSSWYMFLDTAEGASARARSSASCMKR